MMEKSKKSWKELQCEYEKMLQQSCTPIGIKNLPEYYVFDEEKSVRWNREQVALNNQRYHEEFDRLFEQYNMLHHEVMSQIYAKISDEVGHELSLEHAEIMFRKARSMGMDRAFGNDYIWAYLFELIDMVRRMLDFMPE